MIHDKVTDDPPLDTALRGLPLYDSRLLTAFDGLNWAIKVINCHRLGHILVLGHIDNPYTRTAFSESCTLRPDITLE